MLAAKVILDGYFFFYNAEYDPVRLHKCVMFYVLCCVGLK